MVRNKERLLISFFHKFFLTAAKACNENQSLNVLRGQGNSKSRHNFKKISQ
jgi:hypothetical protein